MNIRFLVTAGLMALAPLTMAQTIPEQADAQAAAYTPEIGREAVTKLAEEIEANFVFADIAKLYGARLREQLAAGAYDIHTEASALAQAVTADLQTVAPDGHLRMFAGDPQGAGQPSSTPPTGNRPPAPPAMEQAVMIAPGIAFVRFNAFMGDPKILKDFTTFLDANQGAKTLIIDARTHGGGGLDEMDVLFPRIFDTPRTVMVMDTRASVAEQRGPLPFRTLFRVDAPREYHRFEHRVSPNSPSSPWARAKIYYLTSGRSASAAEHLAMVLKGTGRGTLVGATTYGAGHYGGLRELPGGFTVFIPYGRSYYPGGQGWEQVGVAPDIAVAPERALVKVLALEGVAAADAERLSAMHAPTGSMQRRRPAAR
ncbi:MAG: hypothetical protein CVT77_06375 [Alphaproteobacteria bacterium HGW-Alphaproteobacteria-16]|nr:MAG: hypothetical protein CVT77_06375 [Alphaproteobacteria bacterium HGW-Alphaproteobacteria-16]